MRRLDATLRLFDGDITLTELVHMDLPIQRALIQGRIDNLKESQENFEDGKLDSYSRRYASVMGGFLNTKASGETPDATTNTGATNLRSKGSSSN
jgi:hypothetical protein